MDVEAMNLLEINALEIKANVARRVTFASHQNDVAVIVELAVGNRGNDDVEGLTLEVASSPPVIGARSWRIDRIPPGEEAIIGDRKTPLDGGLLHDLTEAMNAEVIFSLRQGEEVIATSVHTIRALARNEWGGARHMPELLAAFVTPNDPAVGILLKEASDILRKAGRNGAIDGYEAKTRGRVWEIASAIWAAVSARGLAYALPPASFERDGQKVRLPSEISRVGLATCLDTTLLFAAALEQARLKPIVAFTEGHALIGVWLQPQSLPSMTVEEAMELRKAVALDELILFETTLATADAPMPFARALAAGKAQVAEAEEDKFVYAIDIAQARARGVQPLSFRDQSAAEDEAMGADQVAAPPPLDAPPPLPAFDEGALEPGTPDASATPAERLERWRRSLLDLTKRNRMLNLRESRTAIPIFCADPAKLEDRIADGKRIRLISPPEPKGADAEIDKGLRKLRTGVDLDVAFAAEALERNEIVANTDAKSLEKGAIDLFRKARLDMQEGGANTLFLALGMLRWRPTGEQVRSYRAPLILLPVKLERRSAASKPFLAAHDDDPVFNLTLLEMLRQDFDIHLPELGGELPTDESGIDVLKVWDIVRARVREVPGFEVVEDVTLSTFSFAKYLMWKDLTDRTDALKESPFVAHMIDTPREPYSGGADFMEAREIDDRIDPKDLLAPLNADSSQIVAIHASALGGDFVLEGPPGTGKSETIGNIIAHNLGLGRRVLFVSEKMAALEVVYRRLLEKGLGEFCLELHSAKANKQAVIGQLGAAWDERSKKSRANWDKQAERLAETRTALNGLVKALHAPGPAGISPRAAIGRSLRFGAAHPLDLNWPADLAAGHAPTPEAFEEMLEAARSLALGFSQLEPEDFDVFEGMGHSDWSNAWVAEVAGKASDLAKSADEAEAAWMTFAERLGLPPTGDTAEEAAAFAELAAILPEAADLDLGFALDADGKETVAALKDAATELEAYREARQGLSAAYPDERIGATAVDRFLTERQSAENKIWPFGALARGKLRKAIRAHFLMDKRAAARPEQDLDGLRRMAETRDVIEAKVAGVSARAPWRGLETDTLNLKAALDAGERLRRIATLLAGFGRDLVETRAALRRTLSDGRDLLEPGMPLPQAADAFVRAKSAYDTASAAFREATEDVSSDGGFKQSGARGAATAARARRLNPWCAWVAARQTANTAGLASLAEALAHGTVAGDQAASAVETAYCRWAAPLMIDSRRELKQFSSAGHADLIERFRQLDKQLADVTAAQIRARLSGKAPNKSDAKGDPGYGVLARELQKKMRHKPVRQLISEMGEALTTLTPCLMMSPLSVAQFLPAGHAPFDLVVFDEASQITVPDAIGAIARGRNCIIVGDPKQMPPTRFFERGAEDDAEDEQRDLESILDEALAARVPLHRLTGHYRSRHESLICFSNHAYYGGELVTYPSADARDTAVTLRRVGGVYAKGRGRTNEVEAKAVVAEIVERLGDPARRERSIGVVALNSEQQRLIEDLLDQARRDDRELEPFFGPDAQEPVFVKNLETVQGDQRDVILLSIGYGPTEPGARTMSMNFGPLNRTGGERRLNVAITRATTEVVVFASFDADMIDLSRTSAAAVRDLKHYLDFATRGPVALGEAIRQVGGRHAYDSDFEAAVAEGLRRRGWDVRSQIGVSKFRIDLGVVHPDAPGRFLAGVECDGATYHSSPSARDRDRVRHIILEQLGWRLLRIWSTDFFNDPEGGLDRLDEKLSAQLESDRTEAIASTEAGTDASSSDVAVDQTDAEEDAPILVAEDPDPPRMEEFARRPTDQPDAHASHSADPDRFYEPSYLPNVRAMAAAIIDREGPVTFKRLTQQIARAHGFQRTGKEIRSVAWQAVGELRAHARTPDGHTTFWPDGDEPADAIAFRGLGFGDVDREWADVPYPEKLGLMREILAEAPEDPARAVAARIGYARIGARFKDEIARLAQADGEDA